MVTLVYKNHPSDYASMCGGCNMPIPAKGERWIATWPLLKASRMTYEINIRCKVCMADLGFLAAIGGHQGEHDQNEKEDPDAGVSEGPSTRVYVPKAGEWNSAIFVGEDDGPGLSDAPSRGSSTRARRSPPIL